MLDFNRLFKVTQYPAGERHVELKEGQLVEGTINFDCRNFDDLCLLVTAENILKRFNGRGNRWFVPYFPFARHDRRNHGRDGSELELALKLMEGIDVTILDPHSYMTEQLKYIPQSAVVDAFMKHTDIGYGDPVVIIPDQGATKKVHSWIDGRDWVQGVKCRDTKTGELSGFGLVEGSIPLSGLNDRNCLIVDDICDGGGTFLGLAEVINAAGARYVDLAVTHGLFTKGVDKLLDTFGAIYTVGNLAGLEKTEGYYFLSYETVFKCKDVI